ncbi:MAG: hypothetical protein IJ730_00535 [Alphaproteobacteria bacterium]|nr:hypothetical protein [Alphaproteobacteria bacterium]
MSFIMRQSDYLGRREGVWKVLHEHTSNVPGWNGHIVESLETAKSYDLPSSKHSLVDDKVAVEQIVR